MIIYVPLNQIEDNPWQTRQAYDDEYLAELAADIRRNGLLQMPSGRLIFRTAAEERRLSNEQIASVDTHLINDQAMRVQLAIGHNRVRAYRLLAAEDDAYATIAVNVAAYDDQAMARMAWSENAQRRDLTPIEEARAIKHAMDDFGWTQAQAGAEFGLNRATVANKLRLLNLPDEVQAHLHTGVMSERQAAALLPLYQLPPNAVEAAERGAGVYVHKPKELIERAVKGANSDDLRGWVDRTIDAVLEPLDGARFPPAEQVAEGHSAVRHGRCDACELKVKRSGGEFCADAACYQQKAESWRSHVLSLARESHRLKYAGADMSLWSVEGFRYGDEPAGRAIVAAGCPHDNLRLYYDPEPNRSEVGVRVAGAPAVRIVCAAGGKKCHCLAKKQKEATAKQELSPEQVAEKEAKKRLERDIVQPAERALTAALLAGEAPAATREAWRAAIRATCYGIMDRSLDGDFNNLCRILARKTVNGKLPWNAHDDLDKARAAVDELLAAVGIEAEFPAVAAADLLADISRRWNRLKLWIDRLPQAAPTVAALRGNIENVERIYQQLGSMPDEQVPEMMWGEVGIARDLLRDLLPICIETAVDLSRDFERVSWLTSTPPGDINFKNKLQEAPVGVLRYALAIVRSYGDGGHKVRREAIERRLRLLEKTAAQPEYKPLMPELAYDWLRAYVDDDGRTWKDLADNQVHHANSPCYQAFVKAFPDQTDPKLCLKQALARLRGETAVVEES